METIYFQSCCFHVLSPQMYNSKTVLNDIYGLLFSDQTMQTSNWDGPARKTDISGWLFQCVVAKLIEFKNSFEHCGWVTPSWPSSKNAKLGGADNEMICFSLSIRMRRRPA